MFVVHLLFVSSTPQSQRCCRSSSPVSAQQHTSLLNLTWTTVHQTISDDWDSKTLVLHQLSRSECRLFRMLVLGSSKELGEPSTWHPVLRELHRLPVRQRITHKTAVLVYKCLHGLALSHLAAFCVATCRKDRSHLTCVVTGQLAVPRPKTTYWNRTFAVNGPAVCNCLPAELHS